MKKSRKIVAMLIVVAIIMSSFMLLLGNVSKAVQTNVTVEICADSDSNLTLGADNKTLTYKRDDDSTFSFNLKQGDNDIILTKDTREAEGRFFDYYVATGISSNEDVYITCDNADFSKICIRYEGDSIGMWEKEGKNYWASQNLNNLTENSDANHYQFRIESVHDENPQGGDGPHEDFDWANETYTVDFGTASWEIKGQTVTASVEGKNIKNGPVQIKGSEIIKLTGYDERYMEPALIRVTDDFCERLKVNENNETWVINRNGNDYPNDIAFNFVVQRRTGTDDQEDDWQDRREPNSTATINLSSDNEYKDSYQNAVIEINGYPINEEVDIGGKLPAINTAHYFYNPEENDGKIKFNLSTLFIQKYTGTIQINDQVFDVTEDLLDYTNRTDWLNHYSHQMVTLEVDVDKAPDDVYNIKVNVDDEEGRYQWIGNFLWSDAEEEKDTDAYIGHSLLEVTKIVYELDGKEVTVEGNDLFRDKYIEYDPYRVVSSLVVPEGAMCTMKIIPEYGYQVTSFGINGGSIITGDDISEFTFPIHKGNFHLGAEVTKVSDVVDAKSEKVKSGIIKINNNEIDSGSVVLSVNDVNPSDIKIKGFEDTVGEDYTIQTYLDIDLDQVIYKGTVDDVWSNRIHELNNEATITLKLEDGVDGNDIVIVHNIDDGDEYEIIQIESYDEKTNTITFKTKSFSNYAIASKTDEDTNNIDNENSKNGEEKEIKEDETNVEETNITTDNKVENIKSNNPQTGDKIIVTAIVLVLAIFGMKITSNKRKKHSFGKH